MVRVDGDRRLADDEFQKRMYPYINAYVYIQGIGKYSDKNLDYPSYRQRRYIGVDTAHANNDGMTLEEREKDAIEQIKRCIKCYLKNKK